MMNEEIEKTVEGKDIVKEEAPASSFSATKEYAKDLAQVGQISVSELEERIKQILAIMKEQEAEEVVEKSKNAFDQISSHVSSKEKLGEAKGNGTKKSIKELIGLIEFFFCLINLVLLSAKILLLFFLGFCCWFLFFYLMLSKAL